MNVSTVDGISTSTACSVVTIAYIDLVEFEASPNNARLVEDVGKAFGKDGLGILAVTGIPNWQEKREKLLPLAAALPSLVDLEQCVSPESLYYAGWSHGKEELMPGKPDMAKGSYYNNCLTDDLVASLAYQDGRQSHWEAQAVIHPSFYPKNIWPASLPALSVAFKDVGETIAVVGRLLAGVCDAYCQQQGVSTNLKQILTKSLHATGRLLHYFSVSDQKSSNDEEQMWCGWHNDHVSFD
jgi:hypothetical protein